MVEAGEIKNRSLLYFLALSLAVHIALIALMPVRWGTIEKPKEQEILVELDPALLKEWEKQRPRQIAESEAAEKTEESPDARFLGEHTQRVAEETRAPNADAFRKSQGKSQTLGQQPRPQAMSLKNLAIPQTITPPTPQEIAGERQIASNPAPAAVPAPVGGELAPGTSDYLKDVKDGQRTLLNTKEFVYFSYYRRIRERLEIAWNSKLRSAMQGYFVSGRQLASERNYQTRVIVMLDRHGRITNVQMLSASGVRDLDQAAVDAFNQAGPFPDPPSGLIDRDGVIRIPWEFVVQS